MPRLVELARRRTLVLALAALGMGSVSAFAVAQAPLPLPLKITAPAGPGGGWDSAARSLQQVLNTTGIARNVQVVNVPGAGGTVGLAQFANNTKGDGNQLLVMGITMVGAVLTNQAPVGLDAVTPIARLTGDPLVVVVPANSPYKTLADLAAALKADTAKVVWAGGSAGGADHILAGLIAKAAGGDAAKLNYVPFSGGGEALAEMLGGRVAAGVSGYNEFESQIKAGKLRALAVSTPKRIEGVNVPTVREAGLDVELTNWRGVMGGPGLNEGQKAALVSAVERAVKSPEWEKIRKARGWDDAYLPADEFAAFLKSDQARVKGALTSIGLVK
ncbi:tripartite tricarboxylate transporter substrate binding protein [Pigmentiphaga aceris]|uniref:Tripartite tricarboxylate transporter substrate binding protein n=1 Tax=Pigmentiphaga aceris TaxID=1940612 RepID=A0A5C0AXR3_9BURK|nr:tripartite tricarboxylate transporter substrate-binding protein [Pigmentiphaga aceris]QEI05167.1 tripartite tricarboxylate transporter substrate binding protein [Pigmentiphaga aceris]